MILLLLVPFAVKLVTVRLFDGEILKVAPGITIRLVIAIPPHTGSTVVEQPTVPEFIFNVPIVPVSPFVRSTRPVFAVALVWFITNVALLAFKVLVIELGFMVIPPFVVVRVVVPKLYVAVVPEAGPIKLMSLQVML